MSGRWALRDEQEFAKRSRGSKPLSLSFLFCKREPITSPSQSGLEGERRCFAPRVSVGRLGAWQPLNKSRLWTGSRSWRQFGNDVLFYTGLRTGWPRKNGLARRWEADSRDPRAWGWRWLDHVSSSSLYPIGLGLLLQEFEVLPWHRTKPR